MAAIEVEKVAKAFRRLGWIGVWVQGVLATIPLFMLVYILYGRASGTKDTFDFNDYLAFTGLAVLVFTTFWSYRYVRVGLRMAEPGRRPPKAAIARILGVGIWASAVGIVLSLALLFYEVIRLLFLFMKAPQGGVPVIRTEVDNRTAWVSAIDAVSLLAELCTLAGELAILAFSLWLLYRTSQLADDYHQSMVAEGE